MMAEKMPLLYNFLNMWLKYVLYMANIKQQKICKCSGCNDNELHVYFSIELYVLLPN